MIYDILIETLFVLLLVFMPLAYGAVHPWSIAIFEVAAALMGFLWLLKMLSRKRPEFLFSPFFALFLILISYSSLQFFFSQPTTIYSWATKTELLKLISYAMIFLVTLNTIRTKAQIKRITVFIITIGFLTSICYLMRYFGVKMSLGFIDPDHFSAYLGMIIPLSLGFIFAGNTSVIASPSLPVIASEAKQSHSESGFRPLIFFTIVVMSAALFFTMSRGGMFSFIAALVFIALLVSTRRSVKKKGWIILVIAVFIVLIVAWIGATPVIERMLSVKAEIASRYFGGRLPIWQGTIGIIKDNFILGTGLGTFNYIFPKYQPLTIINKHYTYAHSDILELFSETGILGSSLVALCALWSIFYLFRRFRKRHDPWVVGLSICVFGSLVSIFIHSFIDFNLHISANAVLLAVILALFVSILKADHHSSAVAHSRGIIGYSAAILAFGLLIIYSIAAIRPALAAYYASLQETNPTPSLRGPKGAEAISTQIQNTKTAISLDPTNAEYHYKLGRLYGKSKAYELQLAEYHDAVRLNPTNSQYHQSLAWAYGQMKNLSGTQQEFEVAIELSPTYYYPYQAYANWLLDHPTKENIAKGVEVYRKAIALDPKLADKALAKYFKIEKSYAQLKKILPDTPEDHSNVMAILLDAGLWEANEGDFRKDMEAASYKYPYYRAISLYYEKKGDHIKSIQVLADYLKLDPNCADAHFYMGDKMVYIKPVNWQEIFLHYERALVLAPENTFYREWYARRLFLIKRYDDAIQEMQKVVEKDWWNIELYRLLGDWLKTVGRIKDAEAMYVKASRVSEYLKDKKK